MRLNSNGEAHLWGELVQPLRNIVWRHPEKLRMCALPRTHVPKEMSTIAYFFHYQKKYKYQWLTNKYNEIFV